MSRSGYIGSPGPAWLAETKRRIERHPVLGQFTNLMGWVDDAWKAVWSTRVGTGDLSIPFRDLEPRAQIVGDFFESVLALRLSQVGPWRRGSSKEKDLIFTGGEHGAGLFDFEIKTSGQQSGKIYGNRSYAQAGKDGSIDSPSRKKRSGYYLCINFWETNISNIRVGWMDAEDWVPQKSPTGQMAGLKDYVYQFKLLPIPGAYYLQTPLSALSGLGQISCDELGSIGIEKVGELVALLRGCDRTLAIETLTARGISKRSANRVAIAIARSSYYQAAVHISSGVSHQPRDS